MSVERNSDISLVRTLKTSAQYVSIGLYDVDKFLVGALDDRRHARVIEVDGQESDFRKIDFPNKKYESFGSTVSFIPSTRSLIVTDRADEAINVYDVSSGRQTVFKDKRLQRPRKACAGPGKSVFVTSSTAGTIVHMTFFMGTMTILGCFDVGMQVPWAMSVSKDGRHLVVADRVADKKTTMKKFRIDS